MNKLFYLASPLAHQDPRVEFYRVKEVLKYYEYLLRDNNIVLYSPILSNWWARLNKTQEEWMQFDLAFLDHCTSLLVALMEGWKVSKGVQMEIDHARQKGKGISYVKLVRKVNGTIGVSWSLEPDALDQLPHLKLEGYLGLNRHLEMSEWLGMLKEQHPNDVWWDQNAVQCGNCAVEIVTRKGSIPNNNGLSDNEGSEDKLLCGRCAGVQMYNYMDKLEGCVKAQETHDELATRKVTVRKGERQ